MNRCLCDTPVSQTPRWLRVIAPAALVAGLVMASLDSFAQGLSRTFPPTALRGILTVTQPPEVLMDGRPERLSPGARIRGANNLLVLSGTLVGQAVRVNYTREPNGAIHDVWVLTDAEDSLPPPSPR
jgi:hypothetical protein